jgi:dethiobiotin synthetase
MLKFEPPYQWIIAGIGTEVGKTITAAIFTEALEADYWKPVQSGSLDDSDSEAVRELISNQRTTIHREAYRLKAPLSPHTAAEMEHITIQPHKLILPASENHLIVELAGGIMVPLNDAFFNLDLIRHLNLPVVIVANYYLGSINHTLLTVEVLKSRQIPIVGLVLNGTENTSSKSVILKQTQLSLLLEIRQEVFFTQATIQQYAERLRESLFPS